MAHPAVHIPEDLDALSGPDLEKVLKDLKLRVPRGVAARRSAVQKVVDDRKAAAALAGNGMHVWPASCHTALEDQDATIRPKDRIASSASGESNPSPFTFGFGAPLAAAVSAPPAATTTDQIPVAAPAFSQPGALFDNVKNAQTATITEVARLGANVNSPDKNGMTPLHIAAESGSTSAHINTRNKDGLTPVYVAAQNDHAACITELVRLGADINAPCNDGSTPLHAVAQYGRTACITELARLGANVKTPNRHGWAPVHVAAQNGHAACITELARLGANVNTPTNDDWTPLHVAAQHGHVVGIRELVRAGAEINTLNYDGRTPLDIARLRGETACVAELLRLGSNIRIQQPGATPRDKDSQLEGMPADS